MELLDLKMTCTDFIMDGNAFMADLKPRSRKSYILCAELLANATVNQIQLNQELTPQRAQAIVDWIVKWSGPSSAAAVKRFSGIILKFMTLYTERKPPKENPFSKTIVPKGGHIEAWTPELAEQVIASYKTGSNINRENIFLSTLVMLCYDTAQRLGDITPLKSYEIKRTPVEWTWLIEQEKTGKLVQLPMTARVIDRLKEIDWQFNTAGALLYPILTNAYTISRGQSSCMRDASDILSVDAIRMTFRRDCKRLGIDAPPLHGLRKAAVNRLIASGATSYEVMSVTGHTKLATVEMYGKDFDRSKGAERAMEKMGAA